MSSTQTDNTTSIHDLAAGRAVQHISGLSIPLPPGSTIECPEAAYWLVLGARLALAGGRYSTILDAVPVPTKDPADVWAYAITRSSATDWEPVHRNDGLQEKYWKWCPDVRLVWGDDLQDFDERWVPTTPAGNSVSTHVELHVRGTVVQRYLGVYLDDYRALVPVPKSFCVSGTGTSATYEWEFTEPARGVFAVLNYPYFDDYCKPAGVRFRERDR